MGGKGVTGHGMRLDGMYSHCTCLGVDTEWTLEKMVYSFGHIHVQSRVGPLEHDFSQEGCVLDNGSHRRCACYSGLKHSGPAQLLGV